MVERHVAGTRTSDMDAERSRRRESTSDSSWINSDRSVKVSELSNMWQLTVTYDTYVGGVMQVINSIS